MRRIPMVIFLLGALGSTAMAQHAKRPAKTEDTGPVTVIRSATLQIPIDSDAVSIFGYLADQQKLTLWFPDQAILEPHFGGKYHFRWNNQDGVWSGVVTEFVVANTLAFTWKPPTEEIETQVRFKLYPQGGQTLVELAHSGFATDEALTKAVKTWVFYLQNLKSVIEEQTDLRVAAAKKAPRPTAHPQRK
ncbi:MAG: SRPBCC domain-containing protein [Acidobacteriia bacterium]|nr:SRPBCC domain-containing protein [Terriglobia bacterium]